MADGGPQETIGLAALKPKRPFGRSLADFRIEGAATPNGLHPAEERLLACAARGEACDIDSKRPEAATPEKTVRGPFLRFLLLGGDDNAPVHEKGVILHGAFIEGGIDLESATDVRSFLFWRCHIAQPLNGRNASFDDIWLLECQLGSLNFGSASVSGDVSLRESHVNGEVRLSGAEIGGNLSCNGAKLKNAGGDALSCDGAKVTGGVFLSDGFEAEGELRFLGAEIGGQLDCSGAKLKNAGGDALSCDGAKVTGGVFLSGGFEAEGEVDFSGADIGKQFECTAGKFLSPDGYALRCDGIRVGGDVSLDSGFKAEGEVRFSRANIGGQLGCSGGKFLHREDGVALNLQSARITDRLCFAYEQRPSAVFAGSVRLAGAYATAIDDDQKSWPQDIWLDGFTYERFARNAPVDAKTRKEWLFRQSTAHLGSSFRPQPFEQLIKVLREMGHDADARWIGFEKQSMARHVRTQRAPWYYRPFVWGTNWAWGLSCGYGYRPHRLVVSLLVLWLACGFLYQFGAAHGGFAPKDVQVWTSEAYNKACDANWTACGAVEKGGGKVSEIIAFNPFTYSADMLLPAIDLGQRSAWTPMWREIEVALPRERKVTLPAGTLRAVAWVENILGVAGVILIGAILSGVVKRD